ncbi:MAG: hypothetical protein CSA83_00050 [Actinomycetales bacterium]|nr:MAG: hypothetical protein CSA83_00050 [Actinomycetales bacterium]
MKIWGDSVKRLKEFASFVLIFALAFVGSLAAPQIASAEILPGEPPTIDNPPGGVTADVLPTAQINGVVWDQEIVGNTVYVAGEFTAARPAGAEPGQQEVERYNLMSYNLVTGEMTDWAPVTNGRIRVITASPDGDRIYVGGSFTSINGKDRWRIAAFNTADGSLVSNFRPGVGSDVFAIAATNDRVYLGGWFKSVNGSSRIRLAAVNTFGQVLDWAPKADHTVNALAVSEDESRVIVAGGFEYLNNQENTSIGALDADTGELLSFQAAQYIHNIGRNSSLMSLKVVGDQVLSTGVHYGGGNFEGVAVMDVNTGKIDNLLDCHGDTYDATALNGVVYSVSHHHHCDNVGSFPESRPTYYNADGFTLEPKGTVARNNQRRYHNWEGFPVGSMVQWWNIWRTGKYTRSKQAGWTAESAGEYLAIGGEFLEINGVKQQGLVRFGTKKVVSPKVGPAGYRAQSKLFLDTEPGKVTGEFRATWDRDNQELTYKIIRTDKGENKPVAELTANSTPWDRPELKFEDKKITPGERYTYYVIATDEYGNFKKFDEATIDADPTPVENNDPTAAFTFEVDGAEVSFDGSTSEDPDGDIKTWAWDFGDGEKGSGEAVSHTYAEADTYQVKLTVTDNKGAENTITKSVTTDEVAPPQPEGVIVKDDFNRDQSRWGKADIGGKWSDSGSSFYSVDGSHGVVKLSTAGVGPMAKLREIDAADISILTDVSLDKLPQEGPYMHQLLARAEGNTSYRFVAMFYPDGSVRLRLYENEDHSNSYLAGYNMPAGSYSPGDKLNMRFDVTGNAPASLSAKAWIGDDEPADATISASGKSDNFADSGSVGIFSYPSRRMTEMPLTVKVDNYQVTEI